jgi:hypothetical protein
MLLAGKVRVEENQIAQVSASSGIRLTVAPWVPLPDEDGWWGAIPVGQSADKKIHWSRSVDALLVPPGEYDVYWKQDYHHQPMLLAGKVRVEENQVAQVSASSGIRLTVAPWVRQPDENGWWGAVPAGESADKKIHSSRSAGAFVVPPGEYDVYWKQDFQHQPMLLAGKVRVEENRVAEVNASSGIRLKVPLDTPALDSKDGWWGLVRTGGKPEEPIHWSKGEFDQPLLVAPGVYDIVRKQNYRHKPDTIETGTVVKENVLIEVKAQPPKVALPI